MFTQAQDLITIASFATGLIFYAPWLIVLLLLALVPAFLGEAHFNALSYSLDNHSQTYAPEDQGVGVPEQPLECKRFARGAYIHFIAGSYLNYARCLCVSLASSIEQPKQGVPAWQSLHHQRLG